SAWAEMTWMVLLLRMGGLLAAERCKAGWGKARVGRERFLQRNRAGAFKGSGSGFSKTPSAREA
ncbi:MAG: hypothetical protein WBB13_10360, partial [Tabrizicola sp.]